MSAKIFNLNRAKYVHSLIDTIAKLNSKYDFADLGGEIQPLTSIYDMNSFTVLEEQKEKNTGGILVRWGLKNYPQRRILCSLTLSYRYTTDDQPYKITIIAYGEDFEDQVRRIAHSLTPNSGLEEIKIVVNATVLNEDYKNRYISR